MSLISASSLKRCGLARKLQKERPPSSNSKAAMARGSIFHRCVEDWALTGSLPLPQDDDEIAGWLEVLRTKWRPQRGMLFELAVGLGPECNHVAVLEPEPHVYVPVVPRTPMLTAGRADVAWLAMRDGKKRAHVVDWKTGAYPPEHASTNLQFWALGLSIACMMRADEVQVGAYHARDGVFEWSDPVEVGGEAARLT